MGKVITFPVSRIVSQKLKDKLLEQSVREMLKRVEIDPVEASIRLSQLNN